MERQIIFLRSSRTDSFVFYVMKLTILERGEVSLDVTHEQR